VASKSRTIRAVPAQKAGALTEKVRETLSHLQLQAEDVGISAVALQYAETIDRAEELAEAAANIPYDPDTAVMVARLKARVEAHMVMAELGPKLTQALVELGATPRARAQAGKPAPAGTTSRLTAMRGGAS
jgi:ABC-type Na+ efflux pump permease subunit